MKILALRYVDWGKAFLFIKAIRYWLKKLGMNSILFL